MIIYNTMIINSTVLQDLEYIRESIYSTVIINSTVLQDLEYLTETVYSTVLQEYMI